MTSAEHASTGRWALSIRQPWAQLILTGAKPVENRTWSTWYRGPLCIHAGQRVDPAGLAVAAALGVALPDPLPAGMFLGQVVLTDAHPAAGCCRPWGEPAAMHWTLTTPRPFDHPVPGRGRLGLFPTPQEVTDHAHH